jgi:hypothetical protein
VDWEALGFTDEELEEMPRLRWFKCKVWEGVGLVASRSLTTWA